MVVAQLRAAALACLLIGASDAFQPCPQPVDARRLRAPYRRSPSLASRGISASAGVPPLPLAASVQGLLGGFFEGFGGGGSSRGVWRGVRRERREELKAALAEAVEERQGRDARSRVERILEELIALGGPIERRDKLAGLWTLIWSSQTADSNPFARPSSVLGGDCFQRIVPEDAGAARAENLVVWPMLGGLTLNGGATLEAVNATRSILRIDSFRLELGDISLQLLELTKLAPLTVRDAPIVKQGSQLVSVSKQGNERVLNKREGYLDLLYFDDEGLRISIGEQGSLPSCH